MTGLDINKEHIIEMACIITDKDLRPLCEGLTVVIHQPDYVLDNMGEWCTKHHGESGLTKAVKESEVSLQQCEQMMIDLVQRYTKKGRCCLAGNSVHCDKEFLNKYMPNFMDHLHYRIIDVSTIKELARRWYHIAYTGLPAKRLNHRALDDIIESIEELKYYRKFVFK